MCVCACVLCCCFGSFFSFRQIVNDNMMYAKVVVRMGIRTECKNCDFSDIVEDEDVRQQCRRGRHVFDVL